MIGYKTGILIMILSFSLQTNTFDLKKSMFNLISPLYCKHYECCNDNWIYASVKDLKYALNQRLYGQHLVTDVVVKHIHAHFNSPPTRALALSFHGTTGTGKNHASQIIVESIFKEGMKSKFVHLMIATRDFTNKNNVDQYKEMLKQKIEESVQACKWTVFIFDEFEKMPNGIIDVIKPYLDHYSNVGGFDFRKATFIFLSNIGGNDIAKKAVEVWQEGKSRQSIRLRDMENVIKLAAFNIQEGGMYESDLISKDLISAYIPFLPLERDHVFSCILDAIRASRPNYGSIDMAVLQDIADELRYFPEGISVFSVTGCKRVKDKVALILPSKRNEL